MPKLKLSPQDADERSIAFLERLNQLSIECYEFVKSIRIEGDQVESLNDVARIDIDYSEEENSICIGTLNYFTNVVIPETIRFDIEEIYVELFFQ